MQDEPKEHNKNYAHTLLFSQSHQYFTPFPVKESQISSVVQKTFLKSSQAMEEQGEKQEYHSEDKEKAEYYLK